MTIGKRLRRPLTAGRTMLAALLCLYGLVFGFPAAAADLPLANAWGIDVREVFGRASASDEAPLQILGVYLHEGRITLRLAPNITAGTPVQLVDFETGQRANAPSPLGEDYHQLDVVQRVSEGKAALSAIAVCDFGSLHSYLRYSNGSGASLVARQFFLVRKLVLTRPVEIKMVEFPDKCGAEEAPPPYTTLAPIVAGNLAIVNLGDGTALVWDTEWTSEVIRFRIADGTTAYLSKAVTFINVSDVRQAHRKTLSRPDLFYARLSKLVEGEQ